MLSFSVKERVKKGALGTNEFNSFQCSVAVHVDNSHLICTANQMTGFYKKYNTKLKWIK